jgi:hypothetical protein
MEEKRERERLISQQGLNTQLSTTWQFTRYRERTATERVSKNILAMESISLVNISFFRTLHVPFGRERTVQIPIA